MPSCAPIRLRAAALRDAEGVRLGRFGLEDGPDARCHRWEWLGKPWPDAPFQMLPDAFEPLPEPALSRTYDLPAAIRSARLAGVEAAEPTHRIYDVMRVDGPARRLAALVAYGHTLRWYEVSHGGVLEVMPEWLEFVPRDALVGDFSRCLVQPLVRRRSGRRSPPGAPFATVPVAGHGEVVVSPWVEVAPPGP